MRILIWNIQNFTSARIFGRPAPGAEGAANVASAQANLDYILSTVDQANPDVFVIVEARSSKGDLATLAQDEGPATLRWILTFLRMKAPGVPWCLVPPLRVNHQSGHTETVGVFWRDDRAMFTGPFVWPHGSATGPPVPNSPGVVAGPYPFPWNYTVPQGTTAAAQCAFFRGGREITFPRAENRRPYLTTFTERYGAKRLVRLFSVHTTPRWSDAELAVTRLDNLDPADWKPQLNEVTVFAGDWNVNRIDPKPYGFAVLQGVTSPEVGLRQVPSWDDAAPNTHYGRTKPSTLFQRRAQATPPNGYLKAESLDYAFCRYGSQGPPPGVAGMVNAPTMMVVDRVAGVLPKPPLPFAGSHMATPLFAFRTMGPWSLMPAPFGAVRRGGTATFTTTMPHGLQRRDIVRIVGVTPDSFNEQFAVGQVLSATKFTMDQRGKADADGGGGSVRSDGPKERVFRLMENFGHLGPPAQDIGTSDHLPILVIV